MSDEQPAPCPGSTAFNWPGISPDMVACPVCRWYTHWQNRRGHTVTARAEQQGEEAKLQALYESQPAATL